MKSGGRSTSLKLKKRWFVLTNNSLDYYRTSERGASKLGTLVLNSLCSVVHPDEKVFKETGKGTGPSGSLCLMTESPQLALGHIVQIVHSNKCLWNVLVLKNPLHENHISSLGVQYSSATCQPNLHSLFLLGYWNVIVHGRKHSHRLYTKMLNEAMRWTSAIQGVIDNKVPIETPTQQLIRDIKVRLLGQEGKRT